MPTFDIDLVRNNEFTKTKISFPDLGIVKQGFLVDDTFAISTESGFEELYTGDLFTSAIQAIGGQALANFADIAKNVYGRLNQSLVKSVWQTINSWTGSKRPSFNLTFLLIKARSNDNVMDDSVFFMSRNLPDAEIAGAKFTLSAAASSDFKLKAPNGYNPFEGKGMISVQIGKWFIANNLNLLSADFEFSKEVTEDGNPLYAQGKISFEPYRMITREEFIQFFPTVKNRL